MIEFAEEELLYFVEACKRLIEIGQLDEAKNIVNGLLLINNDFQAIIEVAAFIFLATGEPSKVEELIENYASKHPFLPFHLGIFLTLARVLTGKSKDAIKALEMIKSRFQSENLSQLELRALNFIENLVSFVKK